MTDDDKWLHVDDWLDNHVPTTSGERFAKEFLEACRAPAYQKKYQWIESNPLYCTYKGKTYRVTGASRLGDIWLTSDMNQVDGYELRVNIGICSEFRTNP